jgi:hypothetical protein
VNNLPFLTVKLFIAPCVVPRIQQGRVVLLTHSNNISMSDSPQVVQHGEKLSVECDPHYEFLAANSTPVDCNNGTWTHIPRCEPGMARFTVYKVQHFLTFIVPVALLVHDPGGRA